MNILTTTLTSAAILTLCLSPSTHAKLCKEYRSCAEVIQDYPDGRFGRRDGDKDGIPCENVCTSLEEVKRLLDKKQIPKPTNVPQMTIPGATSPLPDKNSPLNSP